MFVLPAVRLECILRRDPHRKGTRKMKIYFDCRIELKDFLSDSAPHVYSLRGQTNRVFKCRQLTIKAWRPEGVFVKSSFELFR